MKMQELNKIELRSVNGGSNDSSSSDSGLFGSLGIDNLLSGSNYSQNGDQSKASSYSIGNGVTSSLGGLFNQMSKSV